MTARTVHRALLALTLGPALAALAGCAAATAAAPPAGPVTFTLSVDPRAYADEPIEVTVWNAEQLAAREQGGACVVEHDDTGTRTLCPPGVTLVQPHPEHFTIRRADLDRPLVVTAASVRPGELYELAIGGHAADGCNAATALARGVASKAANALGKVEVMSTTIACAPWR